MKFSSCRYLGLSLFALVLAGSLPLHGEEKPAEHAEQNEKAAWEWTVSERGAARFNLDAAERRMTEQRSQSEDSGKPARESSRSEHGFTETLEGSQHPELIFPGELFEHLLYLGFETEGEARQEARRPIQQRATALGIGKDFWTRLEAAAAPVLTSDVRTRNDAPKDPNSSHKLKYGLDEQDLQDCRARSKAMKAAQAEFGEEEFLRLLYDAVAPSYFVSYFVHEKAAETYTYMEKGCR